MIESLKKRIRVVENFPRPGISFKDITPLLADPDAMKTVIFLFSLRYKGRAFDKVGGIESRGFIFGALLAQQLNKPFILIRKANKLPGEKEQIEYSLEYGTATLELHKDSINPGEKVLLIDDLLATGGTMAAAASLIEKCNGKVFECAFLIALKDLQGEKNLEGKETFSLLEL